MSLTALVEEMAKEVMQYRQQERNILEQIAAATSYEFAEQAAGRFFKYRCIWENGRICREIY